MGACCEDKVPPERDLCHWQCELKHPEDEMAQRLLDGLHCWSAITCRFASARFWLIITNVERKIASSETIIVSSPNGYFSTPKPIQHPNHKMWR